MNISDERWKIAQEAEFKWHEPLNDKVLDDYKKAYARYLSYLGIDFDCREKRILEIGPGPIGCLNYCHNFKEAYVMEPLPFTQSFEMYAAKGIKVINQAAETAEWPDVDEVWMFNLLQHVQNPDAIIEKAKTFPLVRFFEPINFPTSLEHPWAFNFDYFGQRFGACTCIYPGGPEGGGFHTSECAYGNYAK